MRSLLAAAAMIFAASSAAAGPITHADVDRWAVAWNSHDIDTVMALFAPDVVIDQPENPKPLHINGVRAFFGMIFKAYPDFHVVVRQAVVEGTTAVPSSRSPALGRDRSSIRQRAFRRPATAARSTIPASW
jgi:ketosteroid isomerase-like protein